LYLETDIGKDITLGNIYHEYFYLRYNNKHTLVAYTEKKMSLRKSWSNAAISALSTRLRWLHHRRLSITKAGMNCKNVQHEQIVYWF
jgi:hypothetical protein